MPSVCKPSTPPKASRYDAFREGLFHGRAELIDWMDPPPGARVVELGGGTGRNLDFLGPRLQGLASFELVDLCPALLARARTRARGLPNVRIVEADATTYRPAQPVDLVYFSYSLTMIPDWRGARVVLIPGNHGEALREYVGSRFGDDHVVLEAIHTAADGRRYLLVHGDEFDQVTRYHRWLAVLGDRAYAYLVRLNVLIAWRRRSLRMAG